MLFFFVVANDQFSFLTSPCPFQCCHTTPVSGGVWGVSRRHRHVTGALNPDKEHESDNEICQRCEKGLLGEGTPGLCVCHYLLSMRHIPTRNETGWVLNWVLGRSLSACCYLHGAKTPGDTEEIHYTSYPGITFLDSPPPPPPPPHLFFRLCL